jgi:CTP:molybdopterin cytidylyltransferase MocA
MLTSLQCGLEVVPAEAEAVIFTPVDHPHLQGSTLAQVVARFHSERALVTVPTYCGKHGHPVCIAHPLIAEFLGLAPDARASEVIHRHVSRTSYIEVPDPAVLTDVDDQAAYAELMAREGPRP